MTTPRIVTFQSSDPSKRRQPLLSVKAPEKASSTASSSPGYRVGEVAGGVAAECAAVCCCCPCMVVECAILAVYKLPTGICRRIHRKMILRKKRGLGLLQYHHHRRVRSHEDRGGTVLASLIDDGFCRPLDLEEEFEMVRVSVDGSAEVIELDREMWEQFSNAGFWRSPSQRHVL